MIAVRFVKKICAIQIRSYETCDECGMMESLRSVCVGLWLLQMPAVMHLECDRPVVGSVLLTDLFSQRFFGSNTFGDDIRCSDTF